VERRCFLFGPLCVVLTAFVIDFFFLCLALFVLPLLCPCLFSFFLRFGHVDTHVGLNHVATRQTNPPPSNHGSQRGTFTKTSKTSNQEIQNNATPTTKTTTLLPQKKGSAQPQRTTGDRQCVATERMEQPNVHAATEKCLGVWQRAKTKRSDDTSF
jgi:hypothetical protein